MERRSTDRSGGGGGSVTYSYLNQNHGLETFYFEVRKVNTLDGVTGWGKVWTVYKCREQDCLESERFVSVRSTGERVTADTVESAIKAAYDFEYYLHHGRG